MSNLNPIAFNFWLVGASAGFALGQSHGAAIGLAITGAISLVMSFFV